MRFFLIRCSLILAIALVGLAQQKPAKPTEPAKPPAFSDKLGAKLALAQRDYVIANAQRDAAMNALQAAIKEADAACTADGKMLDGQKAECVEKPAPIPPPGTNGAGAGDMRSAPTSAEKPAPPTEKPQK